jgi:hypothetical protein
MKKNCIILFSLVFSMSFAQNNKISDEQPFIKVNQVYVNYLKGEDDDTDDNLQINTFRRDLIFSIKIPFLTSTTTMLPIRMLKSTFLIGGMVK